MKRLLLAFALFAVGHVTAEPVIVAPVAETDPVPAGDDAADDPAIWIHPSDPELSTIIATNKDDGIAVYNLDGSTVQYLSTGEPNNIDLRYGFPLGDQKVDIAVASEEVDNSLRIYEIILETRHLREIGHIATGIEVYGLGMYHDRNTGRFYVFVNSREGEVEQWLLKTDTDQRVTGSLVRNFHVGSQLEGCVVDDLLGAVYIGEENVALWKYNASPDADPNDRSIVDQMKPRGNLTPDVEGLALYQGPYGTGYLIASSQGSDTFLVYRRDGNNTFLGAFHIGEGPGIDAVTHTDGIDVTSADLGGEFEQGLFVAQDDDNPGSTQNFKIVPWESIAKAFNPPLEVPGGKNQSAAR